MYSATLKMLTLACVLLAAYSNAQYGPFYDYPAQPYFFRSGGYMNPYPSYGEEIESRNAPARGPVKADARLFWTTLTLTLTSTTSTSTVTLTTYCTTSTGTLSTCSPGRRRRGMATKNVRGLFYNEENESPSSDMFFSSPEKAEEPVAKIEEPARPVRETPSVPVMIQPGFRGPEAMGSGRFLLAFATSTSTTTTTTTSTSVLTAICSSTTSWPTCASGK